MRYRVVDLGLIDFEKAWHLQKEVFAQVKAGLNESALIFCRHHPVITLGRAYRPENILAPETELEKRKIKTYRIERGGDVTYHGPGQLTLYPVMDLRCLRQDIHWFLRQLESVIIRSLSAFGIQAQRQAGATGVWVAQKKIASIGIAIRNWITFHGVSLNIKKNDLPNFALIKPCGMDITMTALEEITGRDIEITAVREELLRQFTQNFGG